MDNNKKIRILLIDNSMIFREILPVYVVQDESIDSVETASSVDEAIKKIEQTKPDVITVNIEMPHFEISSFFETINKITHAPVVVISSVPEKAFKALENGAVDYVRKPSVKDAQDLKKFASRFVSIIKGVENSKRISSENAAKKIKTIKTDSIREKNDTIIAIGASTGGVEALVSVVTQFPADMPPVLITQHMPEKFTEMFADRLNGLSKMDVKEAKDGDRVRQGLAIVAAGKFHMRLCKDKDGYYITSKQGEKVSGHCPSVDVLFSSVAETAGEKAIGVILTGMGQDGAEGLLKMKTAGAFTIGQDKESSVVYGMPMVAYKIGAVDVQKSLNKIPEEILKHLKG